MHKEKLTNVNPPRITTEPLILREDGSERRQYQNQMMKINRHLKDIASLIKLPVSLSLYYSRHSWATIARGKDIPLSVISEALGHDSEITTQIYLDTIKINST
jgi:integrase